jgi:hypothetical protein
MLPPSFVGRTDMADDRSDSAKINCRPAATIDRPFVDRPYDFRLFVHPGFKS